MWTHVFTLSLIQSLPLDRVRFPPAIGQDAHQKAGSSWTLRPLTTGPPFTVLFRCPADWRRRRLAAPIVPTYSPCPNFSTRRTVREDYFGMGAANGSFFQIPHQRPPAGPVQTMGVFGTLGPQHISWPRLPAILTWP